MKSLENNQKPEESLEKEEKSIDMEVSFTRPNVKCFLNSKRLERASRVSRVWWWADGSIYFKMYWSTDRPEVRPRKWRMDRAGSNTKKRWTVLAVRIWYSFVIARHVIFVKTWAPNQLLLYCVIPTTTKSDVRINNNNKNKNRIEW